MGDFPQELWVFGAFPSGHHIHPSTRDRTVLDLNDHLDSPPQKVPQTEGEMAVGGITVPGWSYVSWWDRQGDQRGNSHTGILARGTWERWQLVEEGRRRFPWAFRVPLGAWAERPAAPVTVADVIASEQANALRQIAAIVGSPKGSDPTTDLDGLVSMVRGLAERVVGVEARIADAVAADRMAAGEWVRADSPGSRVQIASAIEHGDHIDDDVPPLPSLRMTLLLRDELLRQVESLTAERDRRIEPVVHARAVMDSYIEGFGDSREASQMGDPKKAWREWSDSRQRLLDRLGGLLAEVER